MESSGNIFVPLMMVAFVVIAIAGLWKTFTKAGQPGWACLVPIYNVIVLLQIAGRPVWWLLLLFIPFINIVITFVVVMDIARAFGRSAGFGLGLFFLGPVFYPILGFGSAEYEGAPAH
jgi:hypothetical protein